MVWVLVVALGVTVVRKKDEQSFLANDSNGAGSTDNRDRRQPSCLQDFLQVSRLACFTSTAGEATTDMARREPTRAVRRERITKEIKESAKAQT